MFSAIFLLISCQIIWSNGSPLFDNPLFPTDIFDVSCAADLESYNDCIEDKNGGPVAYKADKLIPAKNEFENKLKQCLINAGCKRKNVIDALRSHGLKLSMEEKFSLNGSNSSYRLGEMESQARRCGIKLLEEKLLTQIESCTAQKIETDDWTFGSVSLEENPGDPELANPARTARRHLNDMIEMALEVKSLASKVTVCEKPSAQKKAKSCIDELIGDAQSDHALYHSVKPYNRYKTQLCQARKLCETEKIFDAMCLGKRDEIRGKATECIWEVLDENWEGHFSEFLSCVREESKIPLFPSSKLTNVGQGKQIQTIAKEELDQKLVNFFPSKLAQIRNYSHEVCGDEITFGDLHGDIYQAMELSFEDGSLGLIVLPNTKQTGKPVHLPLPTPAADGGDVPIFPFHMDVDFNHEDTSFPGSGAVGETPKLSDPKMHPQCSVHMNALQGVLKWLGDICARGEDPSKWGFGNQTHLEGVDNDCKCRDVRSPVKNVSYIDDLKVADWIAKNQKAAKTGTAVGNPDEAGQNALLESLSAGLLTPIKSLLSSLPSNARLSYWGTQQ